MTKALHAFVGAKIPSPKGLFSLVPPNNLPKGRTFGMQPIAHMVDQPGQN
jgi:hypothetical protein